MYSAVPPSPAIPALPSSQSNPIDLTLSDDEDPYSNERMCKRTCSMSRSFNADANCSSSAPARPPPPHSGLSPAMSSSTLQPDSRLPPILNSTHRNPPMPYFPSMNNLSRSILAGPSTPLTYPPPPQSSSTPTPHLSNQAQASSALFAPHHPQVAMPSPRPFTNAADSQVIDLTGSPSPPPRPTQLTFGALPCDIPPKTPVCIGLLTVTALVLYPVPYLQPQMQPVNPELDWAPIRLSYEHNAAKPGGHETIHIRTPTMTSSAGEGSGGENFAVVEQKVATYLGPMLGKGLIRLDGKVRRGMPHVRFSMCFTVILY